MWGWFSRKPKMWAEAADGSAPCPRCEKQMGIMAEREWEGDFPSAFRSYVCSCGYTEPKWQYDKRRLRSATVARAVAMSGSSGLCSG